MKRLALTQQTVRCPREDRTACLTLRTNPGGYPSRRYLDVTACSLLPSTPFVPPPSSAYYADLAPLVPHIRDCDPTPRHSLEVPCPRPCLAVLNAAESGAVEPLRCTSGISDCAELARHTQSPAIQRLMWFFGS